MRTGSSTRGLAAALASLAIVVVVLFGSMRHSAEARYLPTRSDQTEVETLKSIIRNLMIEAAPHHTRAYRYPQQLPETGSSPLGYLQRRAAELAVSGSNGDESDGYLMGPDATINGLPLYGKQANAKLDRR